MDNDDLINDDFLRNLVRKSSIQSPSDDFVEKVMERISPQPAVAPVNRSFFYFLKSYLGYFLLAFILVAFFWTSDISVLSWLPGKQYFIDNVLPSFDFLYSWLRPLSGSGKGFSIPIMILVASGLFFLVDKFIAYLNTARNQTSA
jgi:hypothetical protein